MSWKYVPNVRGAGLVICAMNVSCKKTKQGRLGVSNKTDQQIVDEIEKNAQRVTAATT